jgi:hypothetical protein
VRQLEQDEAVDDDIAFLIPEKLEQHLGADEIIQGTSCSLQVGIIDGIQRHRRLNIRAASTNDLQIVAWRVHDIVLRLAEAQELVDKDFDLQDSSWDVAMRAFQSKKSGQGESMTAAPRQNVQLPPRANSLAEAAEFEAGSMKLKEAQEHEAQEGSERERKARLREAQARSAREREMEARESRALADKARDTWALASQVRNNPAEYDALAKEAQQYEAQALEAKSRTLHDNKTQLQHQAESRDIERFTREREVRELEAQQRREQEEHERQEREREARERAAKQQEARKLEAQERDARAARVAKEREARERARAERLASEQEGFVTFQPPLKEPSDERHNASEVAMQSSRSSDVRAIGSSCTPASGATFQSETVGTPALSNGRVFEHHANIGAVQTNTMGIAHQTQKAATPAASNGQSMLCLLLPSFDASSYLSSAALGIGKRAGVQLTSSRGTPMAIASACYLVQEALWMSGVYSA